MYLWADTWFWYICVVAETSQVFLTPMFFFLGNQPDSVFQLPSCLSVATGLNLASWMIAELMCATCRFGSLYFPMHSPLLSTMATFMHLHMWPWKLHAEDAGTKRWREPRSLKHHLEKSHPPISDVGNGGVQSWWPRKNSWDVFGAKRWFYESTGIGPVDRKSSCSGVVRGDCWYTLELG